MYIVSESGEVLVTYDAWDVANVARAESLIKDCGFVVVKFFTNNEGIVVVVVRDLY